MPLRMLRPGIITSEAVNSLSAPGEVFYRRLMSIVDDFGRFDGRVSILRPTCYPLQLDRVREADVQRGLAECEKAGLVRLYTSDGKPYVQMLKWDRPRAKTSKWPEPPADVQAHENMCTHALPESDTESESDTETDKHPSPPAGGGPPVGKWFEVIWDQYPAKDGKKAAEKHFKASVKTLEDFEAIKKALTNYLASERVKKGFVKNGSTWFNNWRDWVNYTETAKPVPAKPGEPGYIVTDVDKVIAGFRDVKGISREDKQWREVMWERQRKEAEDLLRLFGGDWKAAVNCIEYTSQKLAASRLMGWGWNAVMARAVEFKTERGIREPV